MGLPRTFKTQTTATSFFFAPFLNQLLGLYAQLLTTREVCATWSWPPSLGLVTLFPQLRALFVFTGAFRGVCKKIDHFPEDADYEQDTAEYLLRKFPYLSSLPGGKERVPCHHPLTCEHESPHYPTQSADIHSQGSDVEVSFISMS